MFISPSLIVTLLALPLNLVAGLSNSITTPLLLIFLLLENRYNIFTVNFNALAKRYLNIIIFLSWSALSCLWSANIIQAITTSCYNIILFCVVCLLADNISSSYVIKSYSNDNLQNNSRLYYPKLIFFRNIDLHLILRLTMISLLLANLIFFVELYTNGFLLKFYAHKILHNSDFYLILHKFDRGCSIISLFSWLVIGYFIVNKQNSYALISYLINLYMLISSDSLSSLVAYVCSTICFSLMYLTKAKILPLIKYSFFILAIIFMIICYNIEPENVINHINMPDSAKHRLYIWHYVANFLIEHQYVGFGLESSRYISNSFAGYIMYQNHAWSLLPLHPHNILLQVFLELGIVGLLLLFNIVRAIFKRIDNIQNIHLKIISLVLFVQYFIIGMISYGVWQRWWISTAAIIYIYWLILYQAYFMDNKVNQANQLNITNKLLNN